jgi:hypothetical protein
VLSQLISIAADEGKKAPRSGAHGVDKEAVSVKGVTGVIATEHHFVAGIDLAEAASTLRLPPRLMNKDLTFRPTTATAAMLTKDRRLLVPEHMG